jgi:hypothetical protein
MFVPNIVGIIARVNLYPHSLFIVDLANCVHNIKWESNAMGCGTSVVIHEMIGS